MSATGNNTDVGDDLKKPFYIASASPIEVQQQPNAGKPCKRRLKNVALGRVPAVG